MIELPSSLKGKMREYRAGMAPIPQEYIMFHHIAAERDAKQQDWVILENHGLVNDGWCDGFKTLELVIAQKGVYGWACHTVRWDTSGAWFRKLSSGGWSRFKEMVK